MVYLFRWKCSNPAAELTIAVEAENDRHAGELAAAMLHDFPRGRGRFYDWTPAVPLIAEGSVN